MHDALTAAAAAAKYATQEFLAAGASPSPAADHVLAAGTGTILNMAGIQNLLAGIFGIAVLTLAIKAALHGHRSNYAGVLSIVGILALAAIIWSIATGNQITGIGHHLLGELLST